VVVAWLLVLCFRVNAADAPAVGASPGPAEPLRSAVLQNLHRITPRVYCGSVPDSDAAFIELAGLGVKSVISVDGARPDIAMARRHGLRYVHLPFGYDGVPTNRIAELTKAAMTAGGPVYVHCHHGKHRGPAAAAMICAATEAWTSDRTRALLEQLGTGRQYAGLYRSVARFHPADAKELDALAALPEVAKSSPLVDAMVAVDGLFLSLRSAAGAGFSGAGGAVERRPVQEATLLWEQFREMAGMPQTGRRRGVGFRGEVEAAERGALQLKTALGDSEVRPEAKAALVEGLGRRCVSCHRGYRD
jgi:protein tyrosine phosphatase (PTP) superfamily phosphohydrolase (DUF442 family)